MTPTDFMATDLRCKRNRVMLYRLSAGMTQAP